MTTATLEPPAAPAAVTPQPRIIVRLVVGFAIGAAALLAVTAAGLLAYDAAWNGKVIPGVHVGSVDLSGLDRAAAAAALGASYDRLADGSLVIRTPAADLVVGYRDIGRRPDLEAMIDEAMAAGRQGNVPRRALDEVLALTRGIALQPRAMLDRRALAAQVDRLITAAEVRPVDATIGVTPAGVVTTPARVGRAFDRGAVREAAIAALVSPSAPRELIVDAPAIELAPSISDAAVLAAGARAGAVGGDLRVADGSATWTIPGSTIRGWLTFATRSDGTIAMVLDQTRIPAALAPVAKAIDRPAVSATFLTGRDGSIIGFSASRDGRALDVAATAKAVGIELAARAAGKAPASVPVVAIVRHPALTTDAARKVAPQMVRLGKWTTWFPIGERNFWGANIWLPAAFINGTVLAPGGTFDWFRAVGPITRARGFGPGGYIDGDHTDPTGALGGGMCSSSTTLFNAALRAGLRMGARANHTYYIDRYPLGLDATVYSGQSVTFTNDMAYPILIRGYRSSAGSRGYVTYEIWGVPDGRTVSISKPVVRNVLKATTRIVYVTTLPPGARHQVEYPVNGMDVSVTRVVRDRAGGVIHNETWYSHYRLWNGLVQVGAPR